MPEFERPRVNLNDGRGTFGGGGGADDDVVEMAAESDGAAGDTGRLTNPYAIEGKGVLRIPETVLEVSIMPVFVAMMRCEELENVARLEPRTLSSVWTIDVKHGSSEETRQGVTIDAEEEVEVEGSRATANLVIKFADATEKAHCNILSVDDFRAKRKKQTAYAPRALTSEDSQEWVAFLAFEARGLDVTRVHVGGDNFDVVSTGGGKFRPDLSDSDWADYDEEHSLPVSVTGLETKVEVVR